MHLTTSGTTRGCGKRKEGGLYICMGLGPDGRPIEEFMIDPPLPWPNGHFQGAELRQQSNGIWDVLLWVGEEYYPYVPDFVEEVRRMGLSKKVSLNIDFSKLTPYQSRIILVHPKAVTGTGYELQEVLPECYPRISRPDPKAMGDCTHELRREGNKESQCVFSLWDLSTLKDQKNHEVDMDLMDLSAKITTPSCTYNVMVPKTPAIIIYEPGIFLMLPFTHFEYVSKKGGVPSKVADKLGPNIKHTAVTDE